LEGIEVGVADGDVTAAVALLRRRRGGPDRARRHPAAGRGETAGEQPDQEKHRDADDQQGKQPAKGVTEKSAAEQHRTDEPAEQPGHERVPREKSAAHARHDAAGGRGRFAMHRAAHRGGAVILEGARAAAAHPRREPAAATAAGARLGKGRG
jgi:hypothetical protein